VDDNSTARQVVRRYLESCGADGCVEADDGETALNVLSQALSQGQAFDLVVLDASLRGTDGLDLASRLSAVLGIPVLPMLDSGNLASQAAQCRGASICHYVQKPVSRADLWAAVTHALEKSEPPAVEIGASRPVTGAALSVLLVEDNDVNQKVAAALLHRQGHSVEIAGSGQDALDMLETKDYDIVLMDVQMPVMDGLTAVRHIRQRDARRNRHTPVIAMTAHALVGDRERCLDAGMDGYIPKPISPADLTAAIDQLRSESQPA
jgi:CheY-like chemotaxis protein